MARLVSNSQEAIEGINIFQTEIEGLKDRLSMARAWYAHKNEGGNWEFGPSKFIGYHGMSAANYLENHDELDGRKTERCLQEWFIELHKDDDLNKTLFTLLADYLAKYGKVPSAKTRINVIRALDPDSPEGDAHSALIDLIVKVARTLPGARMEELKQRLK